MGTHPEQRLISVTQPPTMPQVPAAIPAVSQLPEPPRGIDLILILTRLMRYRWLILAIMLPAFVLGLIKIKTSAPIFKANALVLIESKGNAAQLSPEASMSMFGFAQSRSPTEIEIIKSRRVMGNVVDTLNLTNQINPVQQDWFGRVFSSRTVAPVLELDRLLIAPRFAGLVLTVTIQGPGKFRIVAAGMPARSGVVGVDYWLADGAVRLSIKHLSGSTGQVFQISQQDRLAAIMGLQSTVTIAERGRSTGVLEVSMTGPSKIELERILNAVIEQFRNQSAGRAVAELDSSKEFLKDQLPKVKTDLYAAEERLNQFQRANQSIVLISQAEGTLSRQAMLEVQLNELELQESEIKRAYKPSHPIYRSLLDKRSLLQAERARAVSETRALPGTQQTLLRLKRDVEVNQQIYVQLLNQAQEVDVLKAGTIGNIRILDSAVAFPTPVAPNPGNLMLMSLLAGAGLVVLLILTLEQLRRGIESPEQIESAGLNVPAVVPLSAVQTRAERLLRRNRNNQHPQLLAWSDPHDPAIEALRGLRTSLQFRLMQANNQVVMFSGPAPDVGKSFITANLGAILATAGQRVLLIDGDLRRGYLHKLFRIPLKSRGLSDYLAGSESPEGFVYKTESPTLTLLPRGGITANPSELLLSPRLPALLEWAREHYDLILIDTPPILAVTDAAIIGQFAGTTYLVARHKRVTVREIEATVRRFALSGVRVRDCILNGLAKEVGYGYSGYGYGGYYNYHYKGKSN